MQYIEIKKPNSFTNSWYNSLVGAVFPVLDFTEGRPSIFKVDATELFNDGIIPTAIAYVPECDAKPYEPKCSECNRLFILSGDPPIYSHFCEG